MIGVWTHCVPTVWTLPRSTVFVFYHGTSSMVRFALPSGDLRLLLKITMVNWRIKHVPWSFSMVMLNYRRVCVASEGERLPGPSLPRRTSCASSWSRWEQFLRDPGSPACGIRKVEKSQWYFERLKNLNGILKGWKISMVFGIQKSRMDLIAFFWGWDVHSLIGSIDHSGPLDMFNMIMNLSPWLALDHKIPSGKNMILVWYIIYIYIHIYIYILCLYHIVSPDMADWSREPMFSGFNHATGSSL